jgi:hypothetical protein
MKVGLAASISALPYDKLYKTQGTTNIGGFLNESFINPA